MKEQQNLNSDTRLSTNYSFAYNILTQIMPYLDCQDLMTCSEVCTIWNSIIMEAPFWTSYVMKCCGYHLNQILKKKHLFFRKIELCSIEKFHLEGHKDILIAAENLEELELSLCYLNFNEKLNSNLRDLKTLKITQAFGREDHENPYTQNFFKNLQNLTELSIATSFYISLDDLEALQQLKHLFLDANYSQGFFRTDHNFIKNLESFGIGFRNLKENPKVASRYSRQLSVVLKNMKYVKKLLLHGLDTDFSILETVCKLKQIEILELGIIRAWNHYSHFLPLCNNIRHLCIEFILPQGRYLNIEEIAAQNSILIASVWKLRDTLKELTWVFSTTYMRESEVLSAIQNDKWQKNFTAIWNNISDFKPQNFSDAQLINMAKERAVSGLYLQNLEAMLTSELPYTKVQVVSEHLRKCEFCPEVVEDDINMLLLRTLRKDRLKAHWIHSRLRNKQDISLPEEL